MSKVERVARVLDSWAIINEEVAAALEREDARNNQDRVKTLRCDAQEYRTLAGQVRELETN